MKKWIDSFLLLAYCGFIFYLSSRSSLPTPMLFPHQDKLLHMGAYFIMGMLAWRFFRHYSSRLFLSVNTVLFCSLYGISDEWHQSFVPGRQIDFYDWVADTSGGFLAVVALNFWFKIKDRQLLGQS